MQSPVIMSVFRYLASRFAREHACRPSNFRGQTPQ